MLLWLIFAGMTAAVLAVVLRPAFRPNSTALAPDQNAPEKSSASGALSLPRRRSFTSPMKTSCTSSCNDLRRATSSGFSGINGSSVLLFKPAV